MDVYGPTDIATVLNMPKAPDFSAVVSSQISTPHLFSLERYASAMDAQYASCKGLPSMISGRSGKMSTCSPEDLLRRDPTCLVQDSDQASSLGGHENNQRTIISTSMPCHLVPPFAHSAESILSKMVGHLRKQELSLSFELSHVALQRFLTGL